MAEIKDIDREDETESIVPKKGIVVKIVYWILQGVTLATMIASLILFFTRGRTGIETTANQIFMGALALLTFNIPLFFEKKFKLYIPNYITFLLYLLIFSHFVLGEIYRAYDHSAVFDKLLHTSSGVIIGLISFSIVSMLNNLPKTRMKLSPFFVVIFTFCFTMTVEYLWELFEYFADTFFNANMQRWQDSIVGEIPKSTQTGQFIVNDPRGNGLKDTMGDMMVNILGTLGVCIYGYIGMKAKPDWFNTRVLLRPSDIKALEEHAAAQADTEESAGNFAAQTEPGEEGSVTSAEETLAAQPPSKTVGLAKEAVKSPAQDSREEETGADADENPD